MSQRSRKRNPVPPSSRADLTRAADLYERFTGHAAEILETVKLPNLTNALIVVGEIDFLGYTTVRDGVEESYQHDFKATARPLFCVTSDGQHIVLLSGGYDFTERGIVDK